MIRILVISDVCLYREGLAGLLAGELDFGPITTAASGSEAATTLAHSPVDVALIDLALPDALDDARMLAASYPEMRLVALGIRDEHQTVLECVEAGVTGYVCRAGSRADLVEAIRAAGAGELTCSRRIAGALIQRLAALARSARLTASATASATVSVLTPRESQIVRFVDEGLTNKEIASRLHLSAATVRNHVHNILEKLGARTRSEAAAVARRTLSRA